jgi:hypothetical protein
MVTSLPTHEEMAAVFAQFEADQRAAVERYRRDADGRFAALRAAQAEAERIGSYAPIAAFVRCQKRGDFDRRLSRRGQTKR